MRDRASQQSALAALGQQALSGVELDSCSRRPPPSAARELEVDQVAVLERTRDGHGMLARAGVGLPDGVLGGVLPVGPGRGSPRDLGSESSLTAMTSDGFGVIEAHSREPDHFTADDADFLQAARQRARRRRASARGTTTSSATARRSSASSPTRRPRSCG